MIQVSNVSFRYEEADVLHNISFSVTKSEILGILGPNGAGKTTLLKILVGALHPGQGKILLEGETLPFISKRELARKISFVPQEEEIFLPFTVEQIVLMGRAPYLNPVGFETRQDLETARQAMEETQIWPLRHRTIQEISGGERQRVFLARALCQEAPILMMDEPTSHLDIRYQRDILELAASLNRTQKITVIMTLHDVNLASLFCARLLLLKEGSLFALGQPGEVITSENIRSVYGVNVSVGRSTGGLPYYVPTRER